jgi:hypothetical protein
MTFFHSVNNVVDLFGSFEALNVLASEYEVGTFSSFGTRCRRRGRSVLQFVNWGRDKPVF